MDKLMPILYLLGVFILIFPSFLSSNNKAKVILTNLSIWIIILLFLMTMYYFYNSIFGK